jgi:3-dehydroquinate dehydratase-2
VKILILNGPNLNLLGTREPHVYGHVSLDTVLQNLRSEFVGVEFEARQSNIEGELIDAIQYAGLQGIPVVFNPGGYTHSSVALADAITAAQARVVEVHISNIAAREPERRISLLSARCLGTITGLGTEGYRLAVIALLRL